MAKSKKQEPCEMLAPDFVFETSWEVCNKIGGIYTVLSTRAGVLKEQMGDHLIFVGPDFESNDSLYFEEDKKLLTKIRTAAKKEGIACRIGRWKIESQPIVILVKFDQFFETNNSFYAELWDNYKVNSLNAYGDYPEAAAFSQASAAVMRIAYETLKLDKKKVIAHFNEWTTGFAALKLKKEVPAIATIFTTHATSIGRSIAGNHKPLYNFLESYNGDQMAAELNMEAKHSIEKQTAHHVDCFTTVSDITAKECTALLDIAPAAVLPNGFDPSFVPTAKEIKSYRKEARDKISAVVEALIGKQVSMDALFINTSGRYEFTNKGIDLYNESIGRLRGKTDQEIYAFISVPAHVYSARQDLLDRLYSSETYTTPLIENHLTHWLHEPQSDKILNQLNFLGLNDNTQSNIHIFFVPVYLNPNEETFGIDYYHYLSAMDLTVFPSYYEPWGYTPLESIAFGIPTITTSLAGFGVWADGEVNTGSIDSGVCVIERNDSNQEEVIDGIVNSILYFIGLSKEKRKSISSKASKLSQKAYWNNFITHYMDAYNIALTNVQSKQQL